MPISPSGLLPSQLVQSAISITHACFLFPFLPIPEDPIKKHWQKSHNCAETTVSSGLPGSTATLTHLAFMQYHFLPQRKWATDTQGHSPFSPPPVIIAGAPPTKSHCETQFFACSWVLPSLLYLQTPPQLILSLHGKTYWTLSCLPNFTATLLWQSGACDVSFLHLPSTPQPQQPAGFFIKTTHTQDTGNLPGPSPGCVLPEFSTLGDRVFHLPCVERVLSQASFTWPSFPSISGYASVSNLAFSLPLRRWLSLLPFSGYKLFLRLFNLNTRLSHLQANDPKKWFSQSKTFSWAPKLTIQLAAEDYLLTPLTMQFKFKNLHTHVCFCSCRLWVNKTIYIDIQTKNLGLFQSSLHCHYQLFTT